MKNNEEHKPFIFRTNAVKLQRDGVDWASDEKVVAIKKTKACHFDTPNMNREVVTKDSFDEMFKAMKNSNGIMPSMNWMHTDAIIGTWTDLVPEGSGLTVSGYMAKNVWHVREVILPLLDAGVPLYLSTEGYVPWDSMEWDDEKGIYIAKQFDLIRISLVDVPADFEQKEIVRNAIELHRNDVTPKEKEEPKQLDASLFM